MKNIAFISCLLILFVGIIIGADSLSINKSTVYKVEKGALYTTTLNQLQVITKHCVIATTKIYLDNKPADLFDLKPGFRVVVQFKNDNCKTAIVIDAYSR